MKKAVALSMVVVLCLLLSACSGPKRFNAKFETINGSEQLEFFKDGTIELYSKSIVATGTYEKIGKHTYEVRLNYWFVQMRWTAVIEGEILTMTDSSDGHKVATYYLVGRNTDSSSVPEWRPWNADDEELKKEIP